MSGASPPAPAPEAAGRDLARDALACAGLAVAQVGIGLASGRWGLVAPFLVATLLQPLLVARLGLAARPRPIAYLLPSLGLGAMSRVWPVEVNGLDLTLSVYVSLGLHAAALIDLWAPPGRVTHAWALVCSGLALGGVGTDLPRAPFAALTAVWGLSALGLLRAHLAPLAPRGPDAWGRLGPAALAALLVGGLTVGTVALVDRVYDRVNDAFLRAFRRAARIGSVGGFSGRATLGSVLAIQGEQRDAVGLRAFGARAPGYLRGKVFTAYAGGAWSDQTPAGALPTRREAADGRHVLRGRVGPALAAPPTWRVFPTARYGQHVFVPLEAGALVEAPRELVSGVGEYFTSPVRPSSGGYGVVADDGPWRLEADDAAWRLLPDDPVLLDALDRTLARAGLARPDAAGPAPDPGLAALALARHFARAYRYQFGIDLARDRDPVVQFLLERDHGHCELFASATVLLLRRLGLPARYVTGFVCLERNAWARDLWIARNGAAHAWVELFDPARGWVTVETTPASGLPATSPPPGDSGLLEALQALLERASAAAKRLSFQELVVLIGLTVQALLSWIWASWWRTALALGLTLALAWRATRRWRARRVGRAATRALPADLAAERAAVEALERRLARRGLGRPPAETLHAWSARLEAAAQAPGAPADLPPAAARVAAYAARRYAPR